MHLGSALAMMTIRYETVFRDATLGEKVWERGLPEETHEKREEIAGRLAETMVRDGLSRPLYADMLGYLGMPAGSAAPRLVYLLKAIEEAYCRL